LTAGRWSWKSKSVKKCVITYLPNELALKIDDAKARHLNWTETVIKTISSRLDVKIAMKLYLERVSAAVFSADLGGSSKYSSVIP